MEKEGHPVRDVAFQVPETATMSWAQARPDPKEMGRTGHAVIRVMCLVSSVVSLSLMLTSEEEANVPLYGIQFPVSSKWTFSDSFGYLVGVSVAVMAHSLIQSLISLFTFQKKAPFTHSRNCTWIVFAGDQVLAYAMISAASAAAGVANLNRTGVKHTPLPDFCKTLHVFCSHVTGAIVFAFFCGFLLAASAMLDVISLSSY